MESNVPEQHLPVQGPAFDEEPGEKKTNGDLFVGLCFPCIHPEPEPALIKRSFLGGYIELYITIFRWYYYTILYITHT
jgi:hypothetical protein